MCKKQFLKHVYLLEDLWRLSRTHQHQGQVSNCPKDYRARKNDLCLLCPSLHYKEKLESGKFELVVEGVMHRRIPKNLFLKCHFRRGKKKPKRQTFGCKFCMTSIAPPAFLSYGRTQRTLICLLFLW